MQQQHNKYAGRGGFTLIELAVVILLIGIVAAISVPRLAPVIAFSQLEGAARHIAFYGRSLGAFSSMFRDRMTVRFDLDHQVFYTVRWVIPPPTEEQLKEAAGEGSDQMALLQQMMGSGGLTPEAMESLSYGQKLQVPGTREEIDPEAVNKVMGDKFDLFVRRANEERAKNVKHEGFLSEIGPLFDKKFALEEQEPVEEEITEPQLRRTDLPAEVRLENVLVGSASKSNGVVEVEVSPLGLQEDVTFYLKNEEGEYFTVTWQASSGATGFFEGKRDPS